MTSVCIFSAAWRRFTITRLALTQRQQLVGELAARGVQATNLIAADDENLDIAREFGFETIEVPNTPLGQKCALGLHDAAERADYVVWAGSDDWLHPDIFDVLLQERDTDSAVIHSGRSVAVVNMETGVMRTIAVDGPRGCVPWIIDSRLLARRPKLDLIKPQLKRGLDGALIRGIRLRRVPFEILIDEPHPFRCVDFKTSVNLTPYEGITKHLGVGDETCAWDVLRDWYPHDLVEQARQTHLELANL